MDNLNQEIGLNDVDLPDPGELKPQDPERTSAEMSVAKSSRKQVWLSKIIKGSAWTTFGTGTSQVVRLGSNLILTRLLFPEAFGLMALVQVFMTGLEMFSDVGIHPSIIHSQRGEDSKFLNTAWTIQVIRGVCLWLIACLMAYPAAAFYREPMLMQLIPVVGLSSLISGFQSTKLATVNRKIELGRLTILDLGTYIIGVVVMVVGAFFYKSVWVLVVGGTVNALLKMILSHTYLPGERNFFQWDRDCYHEIHKFGRWIFLSTVITFFAIQGDRLVLGRIMDVRFLGIYGVALMMSRSLIEVIASISSKVLFPFYAEVSRESPDRFYRVLRKNRIIIISLLWSASLFFILFGQFLINIMYDQRYAEAGWILKVLSIGTLVDALYESYNYVLVAKGRTRDQAVLLFIKTVAQFAAILLGYYLGGERGAIIGMALSSWSLYLPNAFFFKRLSLWQPEIDLPILGVSTAIAFVVLTQ